MKRLMCALTVVSAAICSSAAHAEFALTILHTNDFHSCFEGTTLAGETCSSDTNPAGSCLGGSARLMTAIGAARARAENTILLDAGDQFPLPSCPVPADEGRALSAELMNRMGYDAMTLGNHEFDDGTEVLRDFLTALEFPSLIINDAVSADVDLAGMLQQSTIIERGGEQLGIIGLGPPMAYKGKVSSTRLADALQAEVDRLSAAGVNKIIAVSHRGYSADRGIAKTASGIDVIVGGHSHTLLSNVIGARPYPTMVNGVAIVQADSHGHYLGELNLVFDDDGVLIEAAGDPIRLDAGIAEDEEIKALIAEALLHKAAP